MELLSVESHVLHSYTFITAGFIQVAKNQPLLWEYIICNLVKCIRFFNSRKIPHINLKDLKILLPFQVPYPLQRKRHTRMRRAITVLMPNNWKQGKHFPCIMKMITRSHILQCQFSSTYLRLESLIFIPSSQRWKNVIIKWIFLNPKDCRVYLKDF